MKIDPEMLKAALCRAVDDYVFLHGATGLSLEDEHIWKISDEQMFEVRATPDDFGILDLADGYRQVREHLEEDGVPGCVDMEHLAALLFLLSARAGAPPAP